MDDNKELIKLSLSRNKTVPSTSLDPFIKLSFMRATAY